MSDNGEETKGITVKSLKDILESLGANFNLFTVCVETGRYSERADEITGIIINLKDQKVTIKG